MTQTLEVLAFIPARGGSKGLPRKNLLPLGGVPLLARVVEATRGAELVTRIVVSTEDDEIASLAVERGAEAPFRRPLELATDAALMITVVRHALRWLEDHEQYRPDVLVLLQGNSPFTRSADVDRAVRMLLETSSDVVYAVSEITHPPFWAQTVNEVGEPRFFVDESRIPGFDQRQNMPKVYRPVGSISVMRVDYFWNCPDGEPRFHMPKDGQKTRVLILDAVTSLDVDSYQDYLVAQALLSHHRQDVPTPASR